MAEKSCKRALFAAKPSNLKMNKATFWSDCKCVKTRRITALMNKFKRISLIGKRYENVSFETCETGKNSSFDKVHLTCRKYAENWQEMAEKGLGIYLYGEFGVGKTHLAACLANVLIGEIAHIPLQKDHYGMPKNPKFPPVLLTNLFEISKAIKATFGKSSSENEQNLIEKFSRCDFLFFDDLGKEKFTKNAEESWINGILFDIINRRYNCLKPTIFTSNYSISELVKICGLSEATADRITEMTHDLVLKISGKSRR
jgi:DNA replication protein DnaC